MALKPSRGWGRSERLGVMLNVGAMTALAAALLVVVNVVVHSLHSPWTRGDWTERKLHTLDPRTRALLEDLGQDVTLALFATDLPVRTPADRGFNEVVDRTWALCREAAALSARVSVERLDHYRDVDRAAAWRQRHGLTPTTQNFLLVAAGDRHRTILLKDTGMLDPATGRLAAYEGETLLHATLSEVTRGDTPSVGFVTGHGERGPGRAAQKGGNGAPATPAEPPAALWTLALREGYRPQAVDLPRERELPAGVGVLVMLVPERDLDDREKRLLGDRLRRGGGLLLAVPPLHPLPQLTALLQEWKVDLSDARNVVLDPERQFVTDPLSIAVQGHEIPSRHPIAIQVAVPGLALFFSRCRPISTEVPEKDMIVDWIAATGPKTVLREFTAERGQPAVAAKPRALAVAVERTLPGAERPTRIVVLSGEGCVSDPVLLGDTYPLNRRLLVASLDWLAGRDRFLSPVPPSTIESRRVTLRPFERSLIFWTLVLILPALPIAGSAWFFLRRRRRA